MRVGLFVPYFDPKPAGVGVYIEEMCRRLFALHRDWVVFTGAPATVPSWVHGAKVERCRIPGSPTFCWTNGALRRAERLSWLSVLAPAELRRHAVDVFFSPVQEGLVVPRLGPPQCMVVHDLTALRSPDAFGRLHVLQTRYLLRAMVRRTDRVVAISESTRRDVVETFRVPSASVRVITEGFDAEVFHPRPPAECRAVASRHGLPDSFLLYAGTLSRHKNLTIALQAFERIAPAHPNLVLALVGRHDAGAASEVRAEIASRRLEQRVRMLGYVDRLELAALLSGCHAFVFPSSNEGFGLAPLEALASGATVLASRAGALPEVVGEGGVLLDPHDAAAWARAMEEVLSSEPGRDRERAIRQAKKFSWDEAAREMLGEISAAAERR